MNALGSLAFDFLVLWVDWFFLGSALAMAALYFGFFWVGFYSTITKVSYEEFDRKRVSDWLKFLELAKLTTLEQRKLLPLKATSYKKKIVVTINKIPKRIGTLSKGTAATCKPFPLVKRFASFCTKPKFRATEKLIFYK